ncbi:porimin-like isoform X1 [Heterodontus francisci]|uniref:porimin-like isoform X1 n=1 Tax=Heterodontus francisci TaxID=7792 RepID=UPI00355B0358
MNSVPLSACVTLLLSLTAFAFSSVSDATTHYSSPTTNGEQKKINLGSPTNPNTVQTTTKPGNITATMPSINSTESTITTVHTTSRPTATKSGNSIATTTTANNTSAGIATTALPIVSHFDIGSFVGGGVLALGVIAVFYFGRRFCISRNGTRYRTIEETEAII